MCFDRTMINKKRSYAQSVVDKVESNGCTNERRMIKTETAALKL